MRWPCWAWVAGLAASVLPLGGQAAPETDGPIVFVSTAGGDAQIYSVRPDGSGLKALTTGPGENTQPAWSPDGRRIAFTSMRDGNMEIYIMDADGGHLRRLTDHPLPDNAPEWSPDGRTIAFRSYRDRHANVYLVDVDSGGLQRLTDTPIDKGPPHWAPDGQRVAHTEIGMLSSSHVMVVALQDRQRRDLTSKAASKTKNVQIRWSPDGQRLAYAAIGSKGGEIHVVDIAADRTDRLTQDTFDDSAPTWSPDGARIAFVSNREGPRIGRASGEIYVMNADGSQALNVTQHPAHDDSPAWSADGRSLYFMSLRDGVSRLYVQRVGDSAPKPITSLQGHVLMYAVRPPAAATASADAGTQVTSGTIPTNGTNTLWR